MMREVLPQDSKPFFKFFWDHWIHIVWLQEELWRRLFLNLMAC
jgi:hypothetical protein